MPNEFKFNIRDKIKCVDDSGQKILKKGEVYTCLGYMGKNVLIAEHRRYGFMENRFEVVLLS